MISGLMMNQPLWIIRVKQSDKVYFLGCMVPGRTYQYLVFICSKAYALYEL